MISYEKSLLEQRKALMNFFVAWEEAQKAIKNVRYTVSPAENQKRGALMDFFVAWEEEQKAIKNIQYTVSSVENSRSAVANRYYQLSPAEKKVKKVKKVEKAIFVKTIKKTKIRTKKYFDACIFQDESYFDDDPCKGISSYGELYKVNSTGLYYLVLWYTSEKMDSEKRKKKVLSVTSVFAATKCGQVDHKAKKYNPVFNNDGYLTGKKIMVEFMKEYLEYGW